MAARDVILMGVLLFTLGIGFFIAHYTINTTVDAMITNPTINASNKTVTALQDTKALTQRLDYIIFAVFIAFILSLIIAGWFVAGNPIFMFINFLVIVVAVAISTFLSNVWEQVTAITVFGLTITSFPITNNLLLNLPLYIAIVGTISTIVMFGKPYFER
jgi:hypothetical protein